MAVVTSLLKRFDAVWLWLALAGMTVLMRLPALSYGRAIDDEAVYAVVARVMLAGGLPYRDAIERKPPLLFVVYWAVLGLFGTGNWLALHAVAAGWVLATMAGLYVLASRLADRRAGILAALAYLLVQPWATAKNLAFNGEVLMNLPLVWAYALILPRQQAGVVAPVAAGTLLAAAFLLKQPAAIAALPLGLYLLRHHGLAPAAALTAGFAAVVGAATAILWHDRLLAEAWYWTFADHAVPHVFWQHGLEHSALFAACAAPLIVPVARWRELRQAWRGNQPELRAVSGWLAVSVIGAAAGGRFYPHYYIQIVPPLAVLAGVAYARNEPRGWLTPRFAAIWLAVAALVSLAVQTAQLGQDAPSAAARYVAGQARPGDRLFVWGQQTPMYLDAGLLPASRYIATYPLTGYIFGGALPGVSTRDRIVPGAWANLAADFARHPPRFIIDTQLHRGDAYPIRDFPVLVQIMTRDYQPIGTFSDGIVYRLKALSPSGERIGRGGLAAQGPSPNPLP